MSNFLTSGAAGPWGMALGGIASVGMGIWGARQAGEAKRKARKREKRARDEMNRLKDVYANLDTSNPFLNMENTMEDLTVNQKQSQFQAQQFQQSQANIMSGLRGAAGGSGIGALAQSLAQQGQLASQKAAANIGQQESANIRAKAQMAGQLQAKERQGEVYSRAQEKEKQSTLLGMAQQETAAYAQQKQQAEQARMQAITGMTGNLMDIGTSMMTSGGGGGEMPEWFKTYQESLNKPK